MKTFLILLTISFGNSEKLDLKYLPPPGSDLAVGSPGAIDMLFRLPVAYSTTVPPDFTEMSSLTSLIYSESKIGFKPDTKVNEKKPLELTDTSMSIKDEGDNIKFQSPNSRPQMLTDNYYRNKDFILKSIDIRPEELFNRHSNTDDVLFSGIFDQNGGKKLSQKQESNMDSIHPSLALGKNHKSSIHKSDSDDENLNSEYDNKDFMQNYQANEFWTKPNYNFTPIKKLFDNTMSNFLKTELNPERRTLSKLILPSEYNQTNSKNILKSSRFRRPQVDFDRNALILNYKNIIKPHGFTYTFNTSNGIHVKENGTATNGVNVQGSYSYTGDDGKFYSVTFTADENGFQPRGEHLPTSPPVPEAILKVIEQAAKNKEAGIFDDGSYNENKYGYKRYQNISNAKKKSHNEDTFIINGADIPYTEFKTNSVETNDNIIHDNDAEIQNKLDTQYSQENEVNFNLTRSNIISKAITNETEIGVAEKELIEDKVTFPEESFEHGLSTDAKKLSPSQIRKDSVTNKTLLNENIHHPKNETAIGMINKISLPRNGNDITVTTTSETLAITNKGYLYIKPQRKFDVFENRFLESDNFILDRKKYDKTSKAKDSEPQPFITPNVSRDYEGSEEDYTDENFDLSDK